MSVEEVAHRTRLSRRQVERLLARNEIFSVPVGGRRLVPVEAYEAWCSSLIERAAS
jgi:excisionase family DNA binding protein